MDQTVGARNASTRDPGLSHLVGRQETGQGLANLGRGWAGAVALNLDRGLSQPRD